MSTTASEPRQFQVSSVSALSAAARVGGAVIALGYLLGLVPGPVVAVVGGMALITYGRNLLLERSASLLSGAALAVLGGALGIAALRWGALDLGDIRGVQSVLGPTVLVGPALAAAAAIVATAGGCVALAVWSARPWPRTRLEQGWWGLELVVGSFAIATVFLDPARSALYAGSAGETALEIVRWIGVIAVVGVAAGGAAWFLNKVGELWRAVAVAVAGAAVAVAAALILSVV